MIRLPPRSTPTDTLLAYPTLYRSTLSLHLAQRYTLQPELIYTRQGANNVAFVDDETGAPTGQENVTIQYLSLGVINKFYFVEGFHGLIGPSLDMKKIGRAHV